MVHLANLLLWNISKDKENMSIAMAHTVFTVKEVHSLDWQKYVIDAEFLELCMPLVEIFAEDECGRIDVRSRFRDGIFPPQKSYRYPREAVDSIQKAAILKGLCLGVVLQT